MCDGEIDFDEDPETGRVVFICSERGQRELEDSPMQTFLPYPNFVASARVLDNKRLGKQRVENLQIMQVLLGVQLANTKKQVVGPAKMFYYVEDADGFEFEVDAVEVGEYPNHRAVMEETRKIVDTDPGEWTVEPLKNPGWANHPVIRMWTGYEWQLLKYQKAICEQWAHRGFKDTCFKKTFALYFSDISRPSDEKMPSWFGNRRFHLSHKSNLVRKDPGYYGPIFKVPDDLDYVWPISDRI